MEELNRFFVTLQKLRRFNTIRRTECRFRRPSEPFVEAVNISRLAPLPRWSWIGPLGLTVVLLAILGGNPNCELLGQISFPLSDRQEETDERRAFRLFNEGKFLDAIALAKANDAKLGQYSVEEKWSILVIRAQLAMGEYASALESLNQALELKRFQYSIRHRWIGIEVCRFNREDDRAAQLIKEISELVSRNAWQYRDPANQVVLGKYFLSLRADAKEVLDAFYNPTKKRYAREPEVYRAIAELAIEKRDFGLAAENFERVVELAPGDPDALLGVALAYLPSDSEKSNVALQQALAINPNHVDSLLLVADQHISSERYDEAETVLKQVLDVNPGQPVAWAYRAVIAHLANEPAKEGEYRANALADWPGNPNVDHVIGRELSEKYRFKEGEKYQRRSIVYDKNYLPAKIQLAHDLLRLGQELEGWKLADEVFDADQYSVVAHNLVTLRDQISKFRTLEQDGFVVRMDSAEAEIYGPRVLELLVAAKSSLCQKYETELESPIFVEIFPRQQDFAIRTFGLPGGAGFLGVCFGRVITMNSPAAQGSNLTSWESVLWHEFCHVVTLQKTKNKMPRWLSEGISVYEEKLADPAWGDSLTVTYRKMMLGDELTPVSELSGAFLRPKTPMHLQFAYYQSSLVVEYLVENFGLESLLGVLDELSVGTPINDALRRHCAPVEFIDKKFVEFAKARAETLAPQANWDEVDLKPGTPGADWAAWNQEHPDNLMGLIGEAQQWIAEQEWQRAVAVLEKVVQLSPETKSAYAGLARGYRELGESEKETQALESLAKMEADDVEMLVRLLEISSTHGDWEKTKSYARRLLAVNPLIPSPYRYLSIAAEKTSDDEAIIESLRVLANMDPLDRADLHFRLASALHRTKQLAPARRQAVLALEQAPRYREAHALLIKIIEEQTTMLDNPEGDSANESVNDAEDESPGSDH